MEMDTNIENETRRLLWPTTNSQQQDWFMTGVCCSLMEGYLATFVVCFAKPYVVFSVTGLSYTENTAWYPFIFPAVNRLTSLFV